jgi:hypothetical protein
VGPHDAAISVRAAVLNNDPGNEGEPGGERQDGDANGDWDAVDRTGQSLEGIAHAPD